MRFADSGESTEPDVQLVSTTPSTESISLFWLSTNPFCISTYEIEVKSKENQFQWTLTNDKYYLLMDNLFPCSVYNIQLKTFDVDKNLIGNETLVDSTKYLGEHCEWVYNLTDVTANKYILTDLQGCETYDFQIYINSETNLKGRSTFISGEQVPGPVSLQEVTPGETTVTIK
uniref:Fibronectin type-III domain-containing protein n=1 Tax=Glossina brevipalpis TaxID=37001 RepID=A0A1A9W9T9_9MUSC